MDLFLGKNHFVDLGFSQNCVFGMTGISGARRPELVAKRREEFAMLVGELGWV